MMFAKYALIYLLPLSLVGHVMGLAMSMVTKNRVSSLAGQSSAKKPQKGRFWSADAVAHAEWDRSNYGE